MASETVVYTPENTGSASVPAWLAAMNNGGGFGANGWGGGVLGFILGILCGGWWNGGFGGFGGNGNGNAAGYLSSQMANDSTRQLVMNAVSGTDADVRALASTLNSDINETRNAIAAIQSSIANVGAQTGMSSLQVINAIQSGNASLASQLATACCNSKLLTVEQGYESQIRTLEQTNQLGGQADRNANSVIGAINAQTVAMNEQFCKVQNREYESRIQALQTELANAQRAADKSEILSGVGAMITPLTARVDAISQAMPPTVAVPYPQLQALPSFNTIELVANLGVLGRLASSLFGGSSSSSTEATKTSTI